MSTYDLLQELATLDEVSVTLSTAMDGDTGRVPPWCELVLEIKRVDDGILIPAWPINARLPLRRHDGELIIEALGEALHPHAANAVAAIWEELDEVVVAIQRRVDNGKEPLKRDVGQALGLATALSHITRTHVDDIRAEVMERWEQR